MLFRLQTTHTLIRWLCHRERKHVWMLQSLACVASIGIIQINILFLSVHKFVIFFPAANVALLQHIDRTRNENCVFKRFSAEFSLLPIRTTMECRNSQVDSVQMKIAAHVHVSKPTKKKCEVEFHPQAAPWGMESDAAECFERRTTKRHPINAIRIVRTKAGNKFFCAKAKNESCKRPRRRPPSASSHTIQWHRCCHWYDKAILATKQKNNNAPMNTVEASPTPIVILEKILCTSRRAVPPMCILGRQAGKYSAMPLPPRPFHTLPEDNNYFHFFFFFVSASSSLRYYIFFRFTLARREAPARLCARRAESEYER